jgi:hypothetical protein
MQLRQHQPGLRDLLAAVPSHLCALWPGPAGARWPEGPVCDTCYTMALRRRGTSPDAGPPSN